MKEYRISKSYKIFIYSFFTFFFGGGLFLLYGAAITPEKASMSFLGVLGLISCFLAIWLLLEVRRLCVGLDDRCLTIQRAFSSRSIFLKDIDGYRRGGKQAFYIIPLNGGKSLKLPANIAGRQELIGWITRNYPDIDERDRRAAEEVILKNDRFGATREQREEALQKSRQLASATTLIATLLFLWVIIVPDSFDLGTILLLLAPWIAVYFIWRYKGLIKLHSKKSRPNPSMGPFIGLPVLGVFIRILFDYEIYDFPRPAWYLVIGGTIGLTMGALFALREVLAGEKEKNKFWTILFFFLAAAVYSYGFLIFSNCRYDHSLQRVYRVSVTDKHIQHDKTDTYYINLSPWGKYSEGKQVEVNESFYKEVNAKDSVNVYLLKGSWSIPWYRIFRN